MLWSTLHNRLGRRPLRVTQHQRVHAVIDGVRVELELKFDATGAPYLVPENAPGE